MSIKYQNLRTFKEGLILLCQSILEKRRITHLHDSAHFTITLRQKVYVRVYAHIDINKIYKSKKAGQLLR